MSQPASEQNGDAAPRTTDKGVRTAIYGLTPAVERVIENAIADGRLAEAAKLVEPLHPADVADLLERLDEADRDSLLAFLGEGFDPEVLPYLDEDIREEVIERLGLRSMAAAIAELDTDDAVHILEELEEDYKEKLLAAIAPEDRVLLEEGLTFPEDSAGRLMQRELVAVPTHWTVGQTIDYLRTNGALPDDFYMIYVVDARYRPVGLVPLSRVLRSKRPIRLADIMQRDFATIAAETDREDVAFMFRKYGLVSAPVVSETGRLLGRITVDDVVDVLDEVAEEDILLLGGVSESDVRSSVVETARARFTWLFVNLGTAIAASAVIAMFESTIERAVALAVLMPIVASMGGNAGTQTLTVAVRAIAMREISFANGWRFVGKEAIVGLINGAVFALLIGGIAWAWFADPWIGIVIGIAMIINLMIAGLTGTLIPLGLERVGIDPAVASAVFLTTVTDIVGFFAFLGLAAVILL